MLSMIFRYPILMSIGNGNINYIQLPIKDDDDVRLMFHVVAQILPSNTIEMYLQTRPRDHSSELSPSFDQEIMGHDVEIPAKGNLAVQIDEMDENLAHNDEMGGNLAVDDINEMNYDDEPPTNKAFLDDGEHTMSFLMFKQLNWDAINSMTIGPLTSRIELWNESNELFKGLRFESKEDLQYAVKRYAICRNQHLVVCESEPQLWAVRCKKWQEGCNWRLRACRRKSHGMFEITKYADRHAGINVAVRNPSVGWSPPHAQHRYCLRHVVSNFNDKFKNKVLKELAYRAGCQHQPRKYERYMEELKRLDEKSVAWFSKLDTQKWTQAYDLGYRYGWMTTNITKCINGVLKGARMLPITALVQLTFYRCVSYFETRRAEIRARMAVGDVYTAYAIEKFRRAEAKASGHTVTIFHRIHETFEVITALHGFHMDKGRNKQVVKLNEGTCSCNKWQSFGIPCSHFYMDRPHTVCMLFSIKTHSWRHKHIWAMPSSYMDEKSIPRYTRTYILQLIGGFLFSGKSSDKVHLMFLPLLEDFEVAGRYTSHIDTHDISGPLILLQLWVWERFPFIAPHRLRIAPHDDQLPPPPLAIRWRDEFRTMHILAQYRHHLDRLTTNQVIKVHDVDWTTQHGDYIRRWSSRREHIARGEMAIGSLGYHDPYMVWYRSITIRFLTRTGSFHELLTTNIHQIYDIAPPDDFRIRRLCTTVLEAIHEMDRLDAPFSVDATIQLQPPSGDVRPTRRGPRTREIRHTPVVARVRPSTDISLPPHQQPTSSITRSGGVRTRGGGPHTRSSPPPHQQSISSITLSGGVRTRGEGPHTRSSPPPHQQPISPITGSGGVRTRGRGAHTRGTRHTSVLRDAPSTDISLATQMMINKDKRLIVAEDMVEDVVGGRGAHGGLHVSPIEPIVEHAHHRRPLRKRKTPLCGTH
ncbi:hypothetical protein AAG906_013095 [Vitis piasezkii]